MYKEGISLFTLLLHVENSQGLKMGFTGFQGLQNAQKSQKHPRNFNVFTIFAGFSGVEKVAGGFQVEVFENVKFLGHK
jgi:hypothetical protein